MEKMPGSKKKPQTKVIIRVILVLGAIGMLVSLYLVKDHYNTQKSICDLGNHFSCSVINKSIYSMLFNVPVAVFGVLWFVVMIGFSLKIWENPSDSSYWIGAHMAWSVIGALFCFYFIYAEFMLQAICPFCTIVHIICFIVLGLSWKIFNQQRTSFSLLVRFVLEKFYIAGIDSVLHPTPNCMGGDYCRNPHRTYYLFQYSSYQRYRSTCSSITGSFCKLLG
jgi:uncharacterized membrane protein